MKTLENNTTHNAEVIKNLKSLRRFCLGGYKKSKGEVRHRYMTRIGVINNTIKKLKGAS